MSALVLVFARAGISHLAVGSRPQPPASTRCLLNLEPARAGLCALPAVLVACTVRTRAQLHGCKHQIDQLRLDGRAFCHRFFIFLYISVLADDLHYTANVSNVK